MLFSPWLYFNRFYPETLRPGASIDFWTILPPIRICSYNYYITRWFYYLRWDILQGGSFDLYETMWYYSLGNTTPREFNCFVPRLMLALWLLSMVVLINAYIRTFTARLAVVKFEPTMDTLEELAASKTLRMTIELNAEIAIKSMVETWMIWRCKLFTNI